MTWDLRELIVISAIQAQGHEARPAGSGVAACLRCNSLWHVSKRALAKDEGRRWGQQDNPLEVRPCPGPLRY